MAGPRITSFTAALLEDHWNRGQVSWSVSGASQVTLTFPDGHRRHVPSSGTERFVVPSRGGEVRIRATDGRRSASDARSIMPGPNPDASWTSQSALRTRFVNRSPMAVELRWHDMDGRIHTLAALLPGKSAVQHTFRDHLWHMRDPVSGRVVGRWRLEAGATEVAFDGESLAGAASGAASLRVDFANEFPFPVELFEQTGAAAEVRLDTVPPRGHKQYTLRRHTVIRARQADGNLVGLYIASAEQRQRKRFGMADLGDGEIAFLTVHNTTPLEVDLRWVDPDGTEVSFGRLGHGGRRRQASAFNQQWLLRDVVSGRLVGSFVVDEQDEHAELRVSDIRHVPGEPIVRIRFTNNTDFNLDMYYLGEAGEEKRLGTLIPGRTVNWRGRVHRPWVAREQQRQRPVAMYITGEAAQQSCTLDFRTTDGGALARRTVINDSLLQLDVYRITANGAREHRATLSPGEQESLPSHIGEAWLIADAASGQVLDFFVCTEGQAEVRVDDRDLVPVHSDQGVRATFTNRLPVPVDLVRVDPEGAEVEVASLAVGESQTLDGHATHPWRARATLSGLEVATVLLTADAEQTHVLRLKSSAPDADDVGSALAIVNDSPLELGVYWMDPEGEERLFKVLPRGQTFETATWPGHFWLLRDRHSGRAVALTRGLRQHQRYMFTGESLRSAGKGARRRLHIENKTGEAVTFFRMSNRGQKREQRTLERGETFRESVKADTVWMARADADDRLLGLYISTGDQDQRWVIEDTRVRPAPPVFTSAFRRGGTAVLLHGARACFVTARKHQAPFKAAPQSPWPARAVVDCPTVELRGMLPGLMLSCPDALCSPDGRLLYVFQGDQVAVYDLAAQRPAPGWTVPRPRAEVIPDCPLSTVRAAAADKHGRVVLIDDTRCVAWSPQTGASSAVQDVRDALDVAFPLPVRPDAAVSTKQGVLLFQGDVAFGPPANDHPQAFSGDVTAVLGGFTSNNRPHPPLRPDEVQLYSDAEYCGESAIAIGDVHQMGGLGPAMARSLRPAPGLGLIGYSLADHAGQNDVFYRAAPQMRADPADPESMADHIQAVCSYSLFASLSDTDAGITCASVMGEDYKRVRHPITRKKEQVSIASYRATVTVPDGTETVWLWATERVQVMVANRWIELDPVIAVELQPNDLGQLLLVLEATEMGVPALQLRTDRMDPDARVTVFPDADLHAKVAGMGRDAIYQAAQRGERGLALRRKVGRDDCRSMTEAMRQVSRAALDLTGDTRVTVEASDHPRYGAWALDLSAVGTERATFFPVSEAEAQRTLRAAQSLDVQVGQGIFGKIGNAIADGAKKAFDSAADLVDGGVDLLEAGVKITVGFAEGVGGAVQGDFSGLAAVADDVGDLVEDVGDAALDAAQQVLEVAIEVGGQLVKLTLDTLAKLGQFLELLLAQILEGILAFLKWLMSLFPWTAIIETQRTLKSILDDGFDRLSTSLQGADGLRTRLPDQLALARASLDEAGAGLAAARESGSDEGSGGLFDGMDDLAWLLNKVFDALPSIRLPRLELPADLARDVSSFVDAQTSVIEALADDLLAALGGSLSVLEEVVADPASLPGRLAGILGDAVTGFGARLLDIAQDLLDGMLALAGRVIGVIRELLDLEIPIPVVKDLYHSLTGSKLSLENLITLGLAVPVTALTMATTGKALQPIATMADKAEAGLYSFSRAVQAVLAGIAVVETPKVLTELMEPFPPFKGSICGLGLWFFDLLAQGSMLCSLANRTWAGRSEVEYGIWGFQWAMLAYDALRAFCGPHLLGHLPWHRFDGVVNSVLAVVHGSMGATLLGQAAAEGNHRGWITWLLGPMAQDALRLVAPWVETLLVSRVGGVLPKDEVEMLLGPADKVFSGLFGVSAAAEAGLVCPAY